MEKSVEIVRHHSKLRAELKDLIILRVYYKHEEQEKERQKKYFQKSRKAINIETSRH